MPRPLRRSSADERWSRQISATCSLNWIRFDLDVSGSSIAAVAAHEMGHIIGLRHSADSAAWTPPSNWQGADVRVRLYQQTTGQIWVDNVRAYRA